jgi:hypothetical protein
VITESLAWDRGKEMADLKRFTVATDIKVYFAILIVLGNGDRTRTPTGC